MKHKPVKQHDFYKVATASLERKKTCPRCGDGTFMAVHKEEKKTRYYCGKCKLTVWE
jgi:ribosomal protein S27AE